MCRACFSKFKSCVTFPGVDVYRDEYAAIKIVYQSLQEGKDDADISGVMLELQKIVGEAIIPVQLGVAEEIEPYDIGRIDFSRLRQEFSRSTSKRTAVQSIKAVVESRLAKMLARNPLRVDFQQHYEKLVRTYNNEKDRQMIEQTFEALLKFIEEMSEEEDRAAREGLDEESLAIYDLLKKPALNQHDLGRVKKVAKGLLEKLKEEKLKVDHWRDKERTRDGVRKLIYVFLFSDSTGLPSSYTENEIGEKTVAVYRHVFEVYPRVPSPYYGDCA